jgi:hypothetical protein
MNSNQGVFQLYPKHDKNSRIRRMSGVDYKYVSNVPIGSELVLGVAASAYLWRLSIFRTKTATVTARAVRSSLFGPP